MEKFQDNDKTVVEISNKPGRQSVLLFTFILGLILFYFFWDSSSLIIWIILFPYFFLSMFYKKVKCTGIQIELMYPFRLFFRKKVVLNEQIKKVRFIAYGTSVNSYAQISVIHKKFPFYFEIRLTETEDSVNFFKWTVQNSNYVTSSSENQEQYIIQRLEEAGVDYSNIQFKYKNKL